MKSARDWAVGEREDSSEPMRASSASATMTPSWSRLQADFAAAHASNGEVLRTGAGVGLGPWLDELLASPAAAEAVPSLNAVSTDALPDGALVRFCGMVQDVQDPEYYDGVYEEVDAQGVVHLRTSMYQGCVAEPEGGHVRVRADCVWQRVPVACVPIPSRTSWVDAAIAGPQQLASAAPASALHATTPSSKRAADEEGPTPMDDGGEEWTASAKRTRPVAEISSMPADAELDMAVCAPADPIATGDAAADGRAWSRSAAGGVLLKMYDAVDEGGEGAAPRLHELVEVIGVLERTQELYDDADDQPFNLVAREVAAERRQRPPPSAQPRLHAIRWRRLGDVHAALRRAPSATAAEAELAEARAHVPALRATLLSMVAASLGGDELAAEYAPPPPPPPH